MLDQGYGSHVRSIVMSFDSTMSKHVGAVNSGSWLSEALGAIQHQEVTQRDKLHMRQQVFLLSKQSASPGCTAPTEDLEEVLVAASLASGKTFVKAHRLQARLAIGNRKDLARNVKRFAQKRQVQCHPEEKRQLIRDIETFFVEAGHDSVDSSQSEELMELEPDPKCINCKKGPGTSCGNWAGCSNGGARDFRLQLESLTKRVEVLENSSAMIEGTIQNTAGDLGTSSEAGRFRTETELEEKEENDTQDKLGQMRCTEDEPGAEASQTTGAEATQNATENAAQQTGDDAAGKAAENASKQTGANAAQKAAENAAQNTGEDAAHKAAEKFAQKTGDEAAHKAAEIAAHTSGEESAQDIKGSLVASRRAMFSPRARKTTGEDAAKKSCRKCSP